MFDFHIDKMRSTGLMAEKELLWLRYALLRCHIFVLKFILHFIYPSELHSRLGTNSTLENICTNHFVTFYISPDRPVAPADPNDSVSALGYENLLFPMAILVIGVLGGLGLVLLEQVSFLKEKFNFYFNFFFQ